jgi:hypothetical protein
MLRERFLAGGAWLSLMSLLALAACGGSDSPSADELTLDCRAQATATVGAYTVNSGDNSSNDDWTQCVALAGDADSAVKMRWTWQGGTSPDDLQPRSQLSLFAGSDGLDSSMPELPAKLNGTSRALLQYDLNTTSSGRHILGVYWAAVETSGTQWSYQSTQHWANVIFDVNTDGVVDFGDFVERATIDGVTYDVYFSGPARYGSTSTTFRPVTSILGKGRLDILAFSNYMKSKTWLTGEEKLAFVQLYNQAWEGQGEAAADTWLLQVN